MTKNIFFFISISFYAFLIMQTAYAGEVLNSIASGHKQEVLIIGEVLSSLGEIGDDGNILPKQQWTDELGRSVYFKIIEIFPQTKKSLIIGNVISVHKIKEKSEFGIVDIEKMQGGKRYLLSLNKHDEFFGKIGDLLKDDGLSDEVFYTPAWGLYELTGTNHVDAKLVKNASIEDEALQIFINSGGTEKDFAFDYSGDKPVLIRNRVRQEHETEEKNIFWYGAGIGILVLIGGVALIARKKK